MSVCVRERREIGMKHPTVGKEKEIGECIDVWKARMDQCIGVKFNRNKTVCRSLKVNRDGIVYRECMKGKREGSE